MSDWLEKWEQKRLQHSKVFDLEVIPTSYPEFDRALGVGGIPRGKIVEVAGHAGVGKTALILDIVAQAQAKNLQVVYLDLDHKFEAEFAFNRAVKLNELLIFQPDPKNIDNLILALKSFIEKNLADIIVIDTISACGEGMVNLLMELTKAIAGTKITLLLASQIREKWQDPRDYNTPFMKVLNQYSNIRIMLKKIESLKHEDIFIGKKVSVDVYKNCLAHPKSTDIEIYV
jgi:recombination protein RecA